MSAELRFAIGLLTVAAVAGPVSVAVIKAQDAHAARINAEQMTGGDSEAGKKAISRYGCGACHEIGGIKGADGRVGPSLEAVASRTEIAGKLANEPALLEAWIRQPQAIVPGNGMPNQGINDRDARDIAAYLYTLRASQS